MNNSDIVAVTENTLINILYISRLSVHYTGMKLWYRVSRDAPPPQVLGLLMAVGKNTWSEGTMSSSGQRRTVRRAQVSPALSRGLPFTSQGITILCLNQMIL